MAPIARPRITFVSASIRLTTMALAISPLALALGMTQPCAAQQGAGDSTKALYIGAINGDDVYVRSGAGESYYPFFKVHRGDLVKVTGEKYGFASISIVGPTFNEAFGFVKQAKADTSRIRLGADNRSGVTLGRVDIVAPNMDAGNRSKDSWKVLARLDADKPLTVLESTDNGQEVIYKVALPTEATGWINAQFVLRASAEDSELFENMLAGKPPEPAAPASNSGAQLASTNANTGAQPAAAQATGAAAPAAPADGNGQLVAENPTPPSTDLVAVKPPEPPAATQPEKPKDPTWKDLENAFKQLQKEPVETAELAPMRDMYAALADRNPNDSRIQRYTAARIKQLDLWKESQQRKLEVLGATERMKLSGDEADAVRAALERSAEYTAVGRVAASTIYDGANLPKLFRLQDPATGRTIAYLKPDQDYALANRIDVIVGIVGDKTYDEGMRLNMITPRRIDVLTPNANAPANLTPVKSDSVEDK